MTAEQRELIISMYNEGRRIDDIVEVAGASRRAVYNCINKSDTPRRYKAASRIGKADLKREKEAITRAEIEAVRKSTKVGDIITIRTVKAPSDLCCSKQLANGERRQVKVVDTSNKRHCLVELNTGVFESILWISMVRAKRNGKVVIS